ncbi:hypothetical protein [Aeromonas salmonicida]|uniref:hypothetical protein n=1 Tax=Aeromonas salmonicida TaxID=645 RepID=UPI0012D89AFF|nr:hypothetical protein [Aeromonas salmonicida]
MKRFTHDADLRGMVVLRSLGFQLVPFKLHRFRKQRRSRLNTRRCVRRSWRVVRRRRGNVASLRPHGVCWPPCPPG